MAADTRPYKSKEQDGQGNELIIRDQQLVEQDTTTTMPAGTCFQTLDVDGRPVKIPKANMVDIVREALGTLLNGLSDQTTVAKFLTLNGNTLGASAAATAASVLGAFGDGIGLENSGLDANTAGLGYYRGVNFLNTPSSGGILLCYKYPITGVMYQVFCSHEGGAAVYSRTGVETGWSSWGRADGFGCATASDLASLLGVKIGGLLSDFNIVPSDFGLQFRVYGFASNTANKPAAVANAGFAIFVPGNGADMLQIAVDQNGKILFRMTFSGSSLSGWGEWITLKS